MNSFITSNSKTITSTTQKKIWNKFCDRPILILFFKDTNLLKFQLRKLENWFVYRLGLLSPSSASTNSAAEGLRKCMDVFFDYGARLTFSLPTWKLWNTKDWKIFRKAQTDEFQFAGYFVEKWAHLHNE